MDILPQLQDQTEKEKRCNITADISEDMLDDFEDYRRRMSTLNFTIGVCNSIIFAVIFTYMISSLVKNHRLTK